MVLLPTSYFPPISWMATAVQQQQVWIEACEHFPKQTWRNRCSIAGSDRIQQLVVPLSGRKDKTLTKDIRIDHSQPWRKIHLRTLQACYRRSPWFEFYEDDLEEFYERKEEFLVDLNAHVSGMLLRWLRKDVEFSFTAEFQKKIAGIDLRDILTKENIWKDHSIPNYIEGVETKKEPVKNLSVLDLLFHQGKNSAAILDQVKVLPRASG